MEVLKVAVFDFDDVENGSSQALAAAVPSVQTAVSGLHWMDMTSPHTSKGRALAALQARFGILRSRRLSSVTTSTILTSTSTRTWVSL